jgi:hypothetical protein
VLWQHVQESPHGVLNYTASDLGTLGGIISYGEGINACGEITG